MANRWIVAAGLGGAAGVALGAAARHLAGGGDMLLDTASRFLLYHALALVAVAALEARGTTRLLSLAGWCFMIGMAAFAGGLTALELTGWRLAGLSTPVGGTLFILGWLALAGHGLSARR
jgi:uncharacterized membrane protein YgdD (TMEM256/DUF423 family)